MTYSAIRSWKIITGLALGTLGLIYVMLTSLLQLHASFKTTIPSLKIVNVRNYSTCSFTRTDVLTHLSKLRKYLNSQNCHQSTRIKVDEIIRMVKCEYVFLNKNSTPNADINKSSKTSYAGYIYSAKRGKVNNSSEYMKFISSTPNANSDIQTTTENKTTQQIAEGTLEVCPETWKGNIDHPFYFTAWKTENCSTAPPFHTLMSTLLYPSESNANNCSDVVNQVVSGLNGSYEKVLVLVANVNGFCKDVNVSSQVKMVTINNTVASPGQVWNALIESASTRYVLVGRGVDGFMWLPNLERPVRVISYENNTIQIVGGAVRNRTGHWRIGCHQSSMKNYILEYKEGYYKSKNECMLCDYLAGPFVARANLLRHFPMNNSLPEQVLFEDFFLRIKEASYTVVNCPDIMYFATDAHMEKKLSDRLPWIPLIRKWKLNRVVVPSGQVFAFSCAESGISCNDIYTVTYSYLVPICCIEQFADLVSFLDYFCRLHKLHYEFIGGSVLGIVKLSDQMPWDADGDVSYLSVNHSFFVNHEREFNQKHFKFGDFQIVENGPYFRIFLSFKKTYKIDMFGRHILSYNDPRANVFREVPTQALFHGRWVFVPPSPGLYARNYFGHEMLRHAHHSGQLVDIEGPRRYKSGYFRKCKNPQHHACLDHFSTDGSLQFYVPN